MKDTAQQSINAFKNNVFVWELIITAIVFTAVYFIFKSYKAKEKSAADENRGYERFEEKEL
jgi:hypothetical protein